MPLLYEGADVEVDLLRGIRSRHMVLYWVDGMLLLPSAYKEVVATERERGVFEDFSSEPAVIHSLWSAIIHDEDELYPRDLSPPSRKHNGSSRNSGAQRSIIFVFFCLCSLHHTYYHQASEAPDQLPEFDMSSFDLQEHPHKPRVNSPGYC